MVHKKKQKSNYDFASADLVLYVWQKRKPLTIIALVAFIFSLIVSLSITPLYKASVIMFPTTGASVSKNLLAEGYSGGYNIYEIGEEEHAENLLQVLNSDQIRDRIIEKYDLMSHYDIKPSAKFPKTKTYAGYASNIRFKRTPYMSVMVEVYDKDPQIAADIANDITMLADTVFHRMIKKRAFEAFMLVENEYLTLQDNIEVLQDSINKIRKLGINHYESQSERYYEAYAKAIAENNKGAAEVLAEKIRVLSLYGGQYVSLRDQLVYETARLSRIKQKYAESRIEVEQSLPYSFVVNRAIVPEKKAYPRKSLIVLVSVFSACLLGLASLLLYDRIQQKVI